MKKYFILFATLLMLPIALQSQVNTRHLNFGGEYDFDYGNGWIAHVTWKRDVNQVRTTNDLGETTQVKFAIVYRDKWDYTNTITGETIPSPGVFIENGTITFDGEGGYHDEFQRIEHYTKDPIFGTYQLTSEIIWKFDPSTGFMAIVDVRNEWTKF